VCQKCQNTMQSDKIIAKIKGCNFFCPSVYLQWYILILSFNQVHCTFHEMWQFENLNTTRELKTALPGYLMLPQQHLFNGHWTLAHPVELQSILHWSRFARLRESPCWHRKGLAGTDSAGLLMSVGTGHIPGQRER